MKSGKQIELTRGKFAVVDDEDFEWLSQWKWKYHPTGYAVRTKHIRLGLNKYKSITVRMHRLINKTPKDLQIDHINRDKLDNRKSNLRNVTDQQNKFNRGLNKNNTSGYEGVAWHKSTGKWRAYIMLNYRQRYLGLYENLQEAVKARRIARDKYFTYE